MRLTALFISLLLASIAFVSPAVAGDGVAVVELFTSEGCSSCPPADALLAKLATEARKSQQAVYCLSFHVDYWDRLGWKDRFSNRAYTQRQQDYARFLKLDSPYTPQIVINGTEEFLGSDETLVKGGIKLALARKTDASVDLEPSANGDEVVVDYKILGAPAGATLCVAWTEAAAMSNPNRGENRGRKLAHINVVRDFQTITLKEPFTGRLSWKRQGSNPGSVIGFVQDATSRQVLGATSREIIEKRR